jgi:hypothetical protein
MKKTTILITTFVILSFFASLSVRATVLFQDALNYPNGCIENDGLWYAYTPATPHLDAFVTNKLLILNQNNFDAVAAPSNNFTNTPGNTIVYASFTINVSTLPTSSGGYFADFKDTTNDYVGHVFIATKGTVVPGTYRLAIDNGATSSSAAGVQFFPLDLATGITYQVVFSYDVNNNAPLAGATLWVNPASAADANVYGTDTLTNAGQLNIVISQIAFSQYASQGVAAIGTVKVGTTFGDVLTQAPQVPVIGIGPQSTNVYAGNNLVFYTAASGLGQLSYQWLSNNVPLTESGTVVGAQSNVVALLNLQNTANYSVAVANSAGSSTSAVAVVTVNTTSTPAFFTSQPYGATNTYGSTITLSAVANGTGPMSYQWYFEPVGGSSFTTQGSPSSSGTLYLDSVNFGASGSYYVAATGGAGGPTNSVTVSVLVVPPSLVTIGFLHSFLTNNPPSVYYYPLGTTQFAVQGVVTSFGEVGSTTYSDFYIQDGTGGVMVYLGAPNTNQEPVGALVSVTGEVEQYYGQLELVANATNVNVISYNNPLPGPALLNVPLMATNPMGAYGLAIQCSLVTITNAYLYSSSSGAAVSGTFAVNSHTALYAFAQPYSAGQPYMELYVYTYTNAVNQLNTNFFGKTIPSYAYQVTGEMGIYSTTVAEVYPTRYEDFVTVTNAPFKVGLTVSNGVSQLTWPAVNGSTYSVYSATNLLGPWTQIFGGYYPTGIYKATNSAAAQFYKVSTLYKVGTP